MLGRGKPEDPIHLLLVHRPGRGKPKDPTLLGRGKPKNPNATAVVSFNTAGHRDDHAGTSTPMAALPSIRASTADPLCDDADPDPADTDNDGDDADNDAVSDDDEGSTPTRSQQNPTTPVDATVGGPRRWSQAEKSRSRAQGTVPGPPDGLYPGAGALIAWQLRGGSVPRFGELRGEIVRARHFGLRTLPVARLGVDGAAETIGALDGAGGCRTECCTRRSARHSPTRLAAPTCSSLIHWSSQGECTGCRRSSRLLDTLFVLEGDGTCCFLATTATTT